MILSVSCMIKSRIMHDKKTSFQLFGSKPKGPKPGIICNLTKEWACHESLGAGWPVPGDQASPSIEGTRTPPRSVPVPRSVGNTSCIELKTQSKTFISLWNASGQGKGSTSVNGENVLGGIVSKGNKWRTHFPSTHATEQRPVHK